MAPSSENYFENDRLILEIPYSADQELVMDILRFGEGVEVLEPATLREKLKEIIDKMVLVYEDKKI